MELVHGRGEDVGTWPADRLERRATSRLVPSAHNARTHTSMQIDEIAASIVQWGWTNPVLIDENDTIIAGHGRVLAAERLAIEQVPVLVARGWSDAQKRAYLIADNKLTELGGWDFELLTKELQDLSSIGFDTTLTGFSAEELAKLEADLNPEPEEEKPELDVDQQGLLDNAWRRVCAEWAAYLDEALVRKSLAPDYTKGALAVYFLRALFYGEDIPRPATLPYNLHRLTQSLHDSRGVYIDLYKHAQRDNGAAASVQWACEGRPNLRKLLSQGLAIHGYRWSADFPALLARDLINEFCPEAEGRILDPCHGWGGRVLGFLLAQRGVSYTGYDVDEKTTAGVTAIYKDLRDLIPLRKDVNLIIEPYERATVGEGFDFALTSPPYFDTERYDGELQSWRLYPTFPEWTAGFYRPLLFKTCAALKPGGVFALQVGDQHVPMKATALANLPEGFEHIETRDTDMTNTFNGTAPDDGEQILILRKANP